MDMKIQIKNLRHHFHDHGVPNGLFEWLGGLECNNYSQWRNIECNRTIIEQSLCCQWCHLLGR